MKHQYLVCDKGGQPQYWASMEASILLKVKDSLSYEFGDSNRYRGGISRITGERSAVDIAPILFLKDSIKYETRIPPLTNTNLFSRDLNICAYCGRHYPSHKLSCDHIHPTSKGGKNVWTNVVSACKACNHEKADYLLHEIDMELIYIPYTPNHAERLLMQNRRVLADQMDYLRGFLPKHSRILAAPHFLGMIQ